MKDAKRRRFDAVVVFKLDRFGRSTRHLINSLAEFDASGIAFVSLSDSLDLSTPQGRLMFHIVSAMAEFERSLIQERVRAGMSRKIADGWKPGRKRQSLDFATIRSRMAAGESLRRVERSFSVSPALLSRRLREVTA
jgi:DNA invertase Pin-like site-specific DNA recombinase